MAYTPTVWVAGTTALSAARMNNLETQFDEINDKFDANTILAANADDTPLALTVAEQRIVGRKTGGNIAALTVAEIKTMLASGGYSPFGDGSDGNVTINADTSLTRDMYYDTLTVDTTKHLYCKCFRIFAKTKIDNNGFIEDNEDKDAAVGGVGATSGGGTPLNEGSLAAVSGGGTGRRDAVGLAANNVTPALGASGGVGGAGDDHAGGIAGTVTAPIATSGGFRSLVALITLKQYLAAGITKLFGGSGGGGGGGDTGNGSGGGGGAPGGTLVLASPEIDNTGGVISVSGGDGGDGCPATNAGGGGGGGGGFLALITNKLTAGTETAAAGAGGTAAGTGVNGTAGSAGTVVELTP